MAQMTESSNGSLPPRNALGSKKDASFLDIEGRSDCLEARMEVWPVHDLAELHASEEDQKRISPSLDALSQDRSDVPCMPSSFSWSLQKAEALLRTRLNPGLRWLLKQKSFDGGSDPDKEDTFMVCQNLTSRSSRRLQQLEQCVLGLSQQWQVQRASIGMQYGCIRIPSPDNCEFHHHPAAVTFGQHYSLLQDLLEDRARLLFLHEFAHRYQAATTFVANLAGLLERERASPGARGRGPCPVWCYGVGALCEELRVHLGHWGRLRAKAQAERWLRSASFWSSRTPAEAQQSLTLLGLQALALTEEYLQAALAALAWAGPDGVSTEALEDTLAGLEAFNHILAEQGVQRGAMAQRAIACPALLTAAALLRILAEHRGWAAAEALHQWAAAWSRPLPVLCASPLRWKWEQFDWPCLLDPLISPTKTTVLPMCPCPLTVFVKQDAEFAARIIQALLSTTNLLVPHIPTQPIADRPQMVDGFPAHPTSGSGAQDEQATKRCKFVQWRDTGKSDACAAVVVQYRRALWKEFGRALLALLYYPPPDCILGSLNQCTDQAVFLLVTELHSACRKVSLPEECEGLLNNLCTQIACKTALSHWDEVLCVSLGTGMKDKCLPDSVGGDSAVRTPTAELLLQLLPPLHTTLNCLEHSVGGSTELLDPRTLRFLQVLLLSQAVVTVHSSTFWVMSKAYQFLCSWSLNKFLLVTLGDLKVLKAAMESLVLRVEALFHDRGTVLSPIEWHASQLTRGVTDLQVFSQLVLRIFSKDCKKMAVEIFEQTMPSGKHWRITCKAELPSSPSDYAASAAQSVIGQVLEGVQPLPDEARIPALTEAMTAFMEAWMEHILKQKIKFSLQGALQLKQDFDLIRDLIRSEEYRLSEEIHQRLLSLQVFHQMDSAIVCLLQQPVAKPYIPSRGWDHFRRCCPNSSSLVDPGSGSLNSLESMDIQAARNQALTEAEESLAPRLLATSPPESYLAISQQEWLALRIHNGTRWKLPGLRCLNKSEP
ncbi:uncharacterized protein ccdc142 isoform X1 [Anguilla anguilla]|uniref:Coiled-coil protein 142 C-terminal domain-containing protein n=2 Tax=Anguilla anguilla TaxID=7936 RepID=A0A9D3RW55_ANGAN|nr:uncharacterized protein ccdc142 isoform X1 [Anguilla anguilla]XP_035281597.1 uncharacterized protein ccdc142 isoform X1 [Anguilla anguilla]XP_035281598.1 uncharacterized protein ccdc142 isoform X1 [Anguilla anguilla]KAG5845383.1 hypothetical protein ANANG_G00138310 [Anguilla anguilla]